MPDTLRWYKGNLHMHSFWSDGGHFPEAIAARFKEHGYHFIAFTEHDQHQTGERWLSSDTAQRQGQILHEGDLLADYTHRFGAAWVAQRQDASGLTQVRLQPLHEWRHLLEEPERFLVLNGEEITVTWSGGTHWINTIHAPEVVPPQTTRGDSVTAMQITCDAADRLAAASGRPIVTFLNHPNFMWNATAEDIAAVRGLRFVEIHTALNTCHAYGDDLHAGAERIWDIALALRLSSPGGEVLYGLANDDCHLYHDRASVKGIEGRAAHPFRAWLMVRAHRLTPDSLMAALHRGDFYASSGVTLRTLDYGERSLALSVEPDAGARYTIRFIGTRRGADLTGAPVLDGDGRPVRTTRRYGDAIGATLAEVQGTAARYDLTGDELYVRALVISDRPHPNPTVPGDVMKAWTQPVAPGRA